MDHIQHLADLGEQTINSEMLYLSLKIEKALMDANFTKDAQLKEAEYLWKEIKREYHHFLSFLQTLPKIAA